MKSFIKKSAVAVLSGAIGFINGFFGGGGGMLLVPMLEKVNGISTKESHATAIAIILPISIISAVIYILNGYFILLPFTFTAAGTLCGGFLGALLLKKLPAEAVGLVFSLMMIIIGIKLAFFG